MFESEELDKHLKTSGTIKTGSLIFTEVNMNDADNVERIGNYRYRPGTTDNQFSTLPSTYDPNDDGGYYTGATDSETSVISGFNDDDQPTLFVTKKEKMKLLYSLEDCIKKERPRSGINKAIFLGRNSPKYIDAGDVSPESQELLNISKRPRYYMSSRKDQFKYWTSLRTYYSGNDLQFGDQELLEEYGIARQPDPNGRCFIYDAAPFVVYKESVPANRIVVKMQTNVGDVDNGPFRFDNEIINDPLYGYENQTTPVEWEIQVLKEDSWERAISFNQNSTDSNGNPIIKSDGYVEVAYGLKIPEAFLRDMIFVAEINSTVLMPLDAPYGYTFLVVEEEGQRGTLYFFDGTTYVAIVPEYGWFLYEQEFNQNIPLVKKLSNPDYFISEGQKEVFREFEFIKGIRVVAKTMNKPESTFDLIEFSPRLVSDITDKVLRFNITKQMSDLGNGSVPVGDLFASTGSIQLFDDDFSFNSNNEFDPVTKTGSIITKYVDSRIKFMFYQRIRDVQGFDYFIPLKTMYADEIPAVSGETGTVDFNLRDKFYFLESSPAPELLMTDVSLSYAVTLLLDYIGFSNYVFKRIDAVPEIVIPYFFVEPNQNVAEVLRKLAIASQTAMFFDEYNNLIVMSKEYLMPEEGQRDVDTVLYGQEDGQNLPNIINLSSEDKKIYNDGKINYTSRYLQREISQYSQAFYSDRYKTFGYKPSLLWEIAGKEEIKSLNEPIQKASGYTLSAAPLNTELTEDVPQVLNQQIINNIIDLGDSVYNVSSYNGYFYANGEVIKYDAVEYTYTGTVDDTNTVWIKSTQDYQKYFSKLPFNGKMYATGNIRIFAEPQYEEVNGELRLKDGPVKRHGRGQFGTPVTYHPAGLNSYWTENTTVKGCLQQSKDYLFNTSEVIDYPDLIVGTAGKIDETIEDIDRFDSDVEAQDSERTGIIKNFRVTKYQTENENNYFDTSRVGTLQSSALVFSGPSLPAQIDKGAFVSYVYKELPEPYRHFGTRMRIVGKIKSNSQNSQMPLGAFTMFQTQDLNIDDPEKSIEILGGSGGISFNLNKETNNGYYFEIVALTQDNIDSYNGAIKESPVSYQLKADPAPSCVNNIVTVVSETDVDLLVGESVEISGLVDSLNPLDTRTPLNGEYKVVAINNDGKTFRYEIPGDPIADRTSTTGGTAIKSTLGQNVVSNIFFYKVLADENGKAIPYKLWSGISNINVNDGTFTGQYRFSGEEVTTVYDLAAEYINIGTSRRFYLYINDKQIATVTDEDPLPEYNNMALFVRGTSTCMFENIYAIGDNISQNSRVVLSQPISKIWGEQEIDASEALRKYALSGVIQKTYLSGIGSEEPPSHRLFFDEFGTIMREAAYLNIKYDRSYPALYAKIMKSLNRMQGYAVSGFYAGSYGAEFMLFNCVDSNLNISDTTGNFLRIQGITFTQNTTKTLTVDDYYKKLSSFTDPITIQDSVLVSPFIKQQEYNEIVNSRIKYGINDFTIESPYIQNEETAEDILGWTINKISKKRILVGLNTFATFNIQLGDIVQINYKNNDGMNVVAEPNKKFVVYNIEYSNDISNENMTLYLAEV